MAQIKKDLTMALKLAVVEAIEEEYWGSVDLEEEKPVMLPRISESVKIQEESSPQKEEIVTKRNWINVLVIPALVVVFGGVLLLIAGNFTSRAMLEIRIVKTEIIGIQRQIDDGFDNAEIQLELGLDGLQKQINILINE